MDESTTTKSSWIITVTLSLIIVALTIYSRYSTQTRVVFCDVGQGDGAYIRTKEGLDILIDAGPDQNILRCLGRYMPFYDRTIELAILSHPQKDHGEGFIFLFKRYSIRTFFTSSFDAKTSFNKRLRNSISSSKTKLVYPKSGSRLRMSTFTITFLWPPKNLFANSASDSNDSSLVFLWEEDGIKLLFTADVSNKILYTLLQKEDMKIDILKVPHHGSKHGLTQEFLRLADPALSVISAGKNNGYGHPSLEVLDLFKALGKKYLRTDEEGDIVIELKGQNSKLKVTTQN